MSCVSRAQHPVLYIEIAKAEGSYYKHLGNPHLKASNLAQEHQQEYKSKSVFTSFKTKNKQNSPIFKCKSIGSIIVQSKPSFNQQGTKRIGKSQNQINF